MPTELLNIDFVPTTKCNDLPPVVINVNFTFRCVPSKKFISALTNYWTNVQGLFFRFFSRWGRVKIEIRDVGAEILLYFTKNKHANLRV